MSALDDPDHYLDALPCPSCGEEIVFNIRYRRLPATCKTCGWESGPKSDFDDTHGEE
jgi:predicted RNA-binding Zn-ribbon protein involved in translation (DUF1610 family)